MPTSISTYAGTLTFLIILAVVFRSLNAFKSVLERRWNNAEVNRHYVVAGKPKMKERISGNPESEKALLTENAVEVDVIVVRRHSRAVIHTMITGTLYLL